jgi:organic radical activating enzyme
MRIKDIKGNIDIKPLKFGLQEVPHLTIEPNKTCNIECRSCYSLNKEYVKSLNDVKKEVDLATRKRNLETITLLGGEPTLHPGITEIIEYIKSKKIQCQLLTNGIVLLHDKYNIFLKKLKNSKVDRVILHVDIGQIHVHKDIDEIRHTLFTKLEQEKIHFALSITIFENNKGSIPKLLKQYSSYKFFDGILAILARDPIKEQTEKTELVDEYRSIYDELDIEPTAYIPSNLEDEYVSWLIYFYFINAHTAKTFSLSPVQDQIFRKSYRLIKGHHLFALILNPKLIPVVFFLVSVLSLFRHPNKYRSILKIFRGSEFLRSIRMNFIAIQTPPEFDSEKNTYQICYHCPDATIRNGMLTPVCVADKINPLENFSQINESEMDLYQTAYEHLEEL